MIVYMMSLVTLSLSKGLGALLTVYSFLCSTLRPFDCAQGDRDGIICNRVLGQTRILEKKLKDYI